MNLKNYYWYFTSALTPRFCDELIKYATSIKDQMALTGGAQSKDKLTKQDIKNLKDKRDSNVVWLNERWIYKEVQPYVHQANENAGWNFQWDFSEACQFTKYNKGQYYDWHCDSWKGSYNNPNDQNVNGKTRKLSVTCSLSDPKDYTGGELEFDFRDTATNEKGSIRKCTEILPRGSIVVFPSDIWHRVCPVKKGIRYSLVMWNLGWPFK